MGDEATNTEETILTDVESTESKTSTEETILTDAEGDITAEAGKSDNTEAGKSDNTEAGNNESSNAVPDTYADFILPEGVELNEAALTEATPLFKELGLTQEQSQKVVDLQAKLIQASSQRQTDEYNQLMTDWRTQSSNDKEYGGDNFDENIKVAQNAITKYGTPELKQLLEEQGVGNHPEVIRFMVRIGNTLKEDVPGSNGNASSETKDRVDIMYPNANKG